MFKSRKTATIEASRMYTSHASRPSVASRTRKPSCADTRVGGGVVSVGVAGAVSGMGFGTSDPVPSAWAVSRRFPSRVGVPGGSDITTAKSHPRIRGDGRHRRRRRRPRGRDSLARSRRLPPPAPRTFEGAAPRGARGGEMGAGRRGGRRRFV
eukprot:335207-Chlamydomonas_euryale.AAC.4